MIPFGICLKRSSLYQDFLANSKETTIHVKSIRILALEVYKTLNNLNPVFMKDYFVPKTTGHNLRLKTPLIFQKPELPIIVSDH